MKWETAISEWGQKYKWRKLSDGTVQINTGIMNPGFELNKLRTPEGRKRSAIAANKARMKVSKKTRSLWAKKAWETRRKNQLSTDKLAL